MAIGIKEARLRISGDASGAVGALQRLGRQMRDSTAGIRALRGGFAAIGGSILFNEVNQALKAEVSFEQAVLGAGHALGLQGPEMDDFVAKAKQLRDELKGTGIAQSVLGDAFRDAAIKAARLSGEGDKASKTLRLLEEGASLAVLTGGDLGASMLALARLMDVFGTPVEDAAETVLALSESWKNSGFQNGGLLAEAITTVAESAGDLKPSLEDIASVIKTLGPEAAGLAAHLAEVWRAAQSGDAKALEKLRVAGFDRGEVIGQQMPLISLLTEVGRLGQESADSFAKWEVKPEWENALSRSAKQLEEMRGNAVAIADAFTGKDLPPGRTAEEETKREREDVARDTRQTTESIVAGSAADLVGKGWVNPANMQAGIAVGVLKAGVVESAEFAGGKAQEFAGGLWNAIFGGPSRPTKPRSIPGALHITPDRARGGRGAAPDARVATAQVMALAQEAHSGSASALRVVRDVSQDATSSIMSIVRAAKAGDVEAQRFLENIGVSLNTDTGTPPVLHILAAIGQRAQDSEVAADSLMRKLAGLTGSTAAASNILGVGGAVSQGSTPVDQGLGASQSGAARSIIDTRAYGRVEVTQDSSGGWHAVATDADGYRAFIGTPAGLSLEDLERTVGLPAGSLAGLGGGVPKMAAGGIVDRPTFALIGEAGPEVVLPLSRPGRVRELADAVTGGASGLSREAVGLAAGGIVGEDGLYRLGELGRKEAVVPLERGAGTIQRALGQSGSGGTTGGGGSVTVQGGIVINSQATDARGIARDIMRRLEYEANYGRLSGRRL